MTSLRLGADPIVGGFPALSTLTNAIHRVFLGLVSAGFLVGLQNDVSAPAYRFFPYDELIRTYKCQITNSVFDKSHLELFNLTTLDGCSLRGTFLPWICRWKTVDLPVRFTNSRIDNSTPHPILNISVEEHSTVH